MKTIQCWRLNLEIANEANSREHWTKKHKRHKAQKMAIKRAFLAIQPNLKPPFKITLTRISSRELDAHDNLPISFKYVVDAIAEYFYPGKAAGRADDSKEITWEYKQNKGKPNEYALIIDIEKDQ